MTKHVPWCAECEGYGIYKKDLFTPKIFGTGDLVFLTWSLTQWPMFLWIRCCGHLWKSLASGYGWRILKGGCSRFQSLSFNSIILLNWDLFISAGIFCCVTNRVEEAVVLLGEYLLFSYLKFNYTNTQIFTCWMNEIWSMKSTEYINYGLERTDLFLRQNGGRFYLFQWEKEVGWTHSW